MVIPWDVEEFNTGGSAFHSTVTDPSKIFATTAGKYLFSAGVHVPGCSARAGTVRARSPAASRSRCARTVYSGSAALALPAS